MITAHKFLIVSSAAIAPASAVAMADFTVGGVDIFMSVAIIVGLVSGAVLRSGDRIDEDAGWAAIRRDMIVSATAFFANFIIAATVIYTTDKGMSAIAGSPVQIPALAGAGMGLYFGYKGRDSIKWFNKNIMKKDGDT